MEIILYSTDYCNLCEEAEALIHTALQGQIYSIRKLDVSMDNQLIETYGLRIPVIAVADKATEELNWPFDEAQIRDFVGV